MTSVNEVLLVCAGMFLGFFITRTLKFRKILGPKLGINELESVRILIAPHERILGVQEMKKLLLITQQLEVPFTAIEEGSKLAAREMNHAVKLRQKAKILGIKYRRKINFLEKSGAAEKILKRLKDDMSFEIESLNMQASARAKQAQKMRQLMEFFRQIEKVIE